LINGSCGSSNGTYSYSAPSSNLCNSGTATSVSQSGNSFVWSCTGTGGTTASCSSYRMIDGVCGGSGPYETSASCSCSVGSLANLSGSGPWTWSCSGINGGTAAGCSAAYGHTSCACVAPNGITQQIYERGHLTCACCYYAPVQCPSNWRLDTYFDPGAGPACESWQWYYCY